MSHGCGGGRSAAAYTCTLLFEKALHCHPLVSLPLDVIIILCMSCQYMSQANKSHGCGGGDPTAAYAWILQNGGIGDDTCTNYLAATEQCVPENVCRNCDPGKGCFAVTKYPEVSLLTSPT